MELLGDHTITQDADGTRTINSKSYNCKFNMGTGYMERWGATEDDDITPAVPEVVDIEVTTSCEGVSLMIPQADGSIDYNGPKKPCSFCYKANLPGGTNMSLETFKTIFDKFPKTVNQIAFSADSTLKANPDLFEMMKYCRNNEYNYVVPSISVAQLERKEAQQLLDAGVGCVGVSLYQNKEVCYDTAKLLCDLADEMGGYPVQVNLQVVVSDHNFEQIMQLLEDINEDPRLEKINCIVYLSLKQKGRGTGFELLNDDNWMKLLAKTSTEVDFFGVDVCSTGKLLAFEGESEDTKDVAEPCEAGYYSMYINKDGAMYPCSFIENTTGWEEGEDLVTRDFAEIWTGKKFLAWRKSIEAIRCGDCSGCVYWDI